MSVVIGLNPSMSGFAVCRLHKRMGHELQTLKQKSEGNTWEERLERYRLLAAEVAKAVRETSNPIFLESYSFGSKNSRAHSTGEFGCYLRLKLTQTFKVRVIEVAPKELKQWITGKGNSGKPEVVSALSVQTGIRFADDNQADAYGLAWIGQCVLGLQEPSNAIRRKIVEAVRKRHQIEGGPAVSRAS